MENCWLIPNPMTPCIPITFNEDNCLGCNRCVNICRMDVMVPNPEKGKPPVVVYPDECWFCGTCIAECPVEDACEFHHPINQLVAWKRKETGRIYRVGTSDNPEPVLREPFD